MHATPSVRLKHQPQAASAPLKPAPEVIVSPFRLSQSMALDRMIHMLGGKFGEWVELPSKMSKKDRDLIRHAYSAEKIEVRVVAGKRQIRTVADVTSVAPVDKLDDITKVKLNTAQKWIDDLLGQYEGVPKEDLKYDNVTKHLDEGFVHEDELYGASPDLEIGDLEDLAEKGLLEQREGSGGSYYYRNPGPPGPESATPTSGKAFKPVNVEQVTRNAMEADIKRWHMGLPPELQKALGVHGKKYLEKYPGATPHDAVNYRLGSSPGEGDRQAKTKVSEYHWHHKNFEDAHQALLYKAQNQVDNLKSRLASALADLEIIKSMTKESIEKEL